MVIVALVIVTVVGVVLVAVVVLIGVSAVTNSALHVAYTTPGKRDPLGKGGEDSGGDTAVHLHTRHRYR